MTEPIKRIAGYDVLRLIARGGMGNVYLAYHPALDRHVALKEFGLPADQPGLAARFLEEARVASSLNSPYIVSVHDLIEHEGVPYIAMEYLEHGSLRPHVSSLTQVQAVGVLKEVLLALAHAESKGIVHRDVKPENVLVTPTGHVKLTDFGIAKGLDAVTTAGFKTATGSVLGTVTYMAPEQAAGQPLGPTADLYALGVMAFEMLVGRLPFDPQDTPVGIMLHHVRDGFPPPRSVNPDLDERLAGWIAGMTAMDPRARPQTAELAWDALEEIAVAMFDAFWEREARLRPGVAVANGSVAAQSAAHGGLSAQYVSYRPQEASAAPAAVATPPGGEAAVAAGPPPTWPGAAPGSSASWASVDIPAGGPPPTWTSIQAPAAAIPPTWPSVEAAVLPAPPPHAPPPVETPPPARRRRRPRLRGRHAAIAATAGLLVAASAAGAATLADHGPRLFDNAPAIAAIRADLGQQQQVMAVTCPPRVPLRPGFTSHCQAQLAPGSQWVDAYVTQTSVPGQVHLQLVLR